LRSYVYQAIGNDQYKVLRLADTGQNRLREYLVDLKGGDMLCDCKGFYYTKKRCKHIRFILSQLATKNKGILDWQHTGDYDRLFASIKRREQKMTISVDTKC